MLTIDRIAELRAAHRDADDHGGSTMARFEEMIRPHLGDLLALATAGLAQSMRLRFLAGAIYDLLSVLDLQARTWLVQHHPEIDDGLSTVEDILREFGFTDSDEEWYGEWAKLQHQAPARKGAP